MRLYRRVRRARDRGAARAFRRTRRGGRDGTVRYVRVYVRDKTGHGGGDRVRGVKTARVRVLPRRARFVSRLLQRACRRVREDGEIAAPAREDLAVRRCDRLFLHRVFYPVRRYSDPALVRVLVARGESVFLLVFAVYDPANGLRGHFRRTVIFALAKNVPTDTTFALSLDFNRFRENG